MNHNKLQEDISHGNISFPVAAYETTICDDANVPLYYHVHQELELLWIVSGKADFWVDNVLITMNQGDVLMIPSEKVHGSHDTNVQNLTFRAVLWNAVFLKSFFRDSLEENYLNTFFEKDNMFCHIDNQNALEIRNLLNQIYNDCNEKPFGYELLVKSAFYQCIFFMLEYLPVDPIRKQSESRGTLMKNIVCFIEHNSKDPIMLNDVAKTVNVSKGYLCRFFNKNFNMTFSSYLTRVRLGNAEVLLLKSDKSITEIAADAGFGNSDYFTVCFKEYYHMTPREYRKQKVNIARI